MVLDYITANAATIDRNGDGVIGYVLQSVISDTMIQSHVQEVFVQHLAQELMQTEQLIQHQPEQT